MEKWHFLTKRAPKNAPPPSIQSSVLHQNKALHNFHKRWQHSVVEHNICIEYTLMMVPPPSVKIERLKDRNVTKLCSYAEL